MFPVGTDVAVDGPGFVANGCVVWALEADRGVMFSTDDDPKACKQLRSYLDSLQKNR